MVEQLEITLPAFKRGYHLITDLIEKQLPKLPEKGLVNFISATHEPLDKAWICASLNPAKAIHFETTKGSIQPGKDADLVLLNQELEVQLTVVEGNVVYRRSE